MNNPNKYSRESANYNENQYNLNTGNTDRTESRSGKRIDKKYLQRIKPESGFVVPWQMYEADPYKNPAE